MKDIFMAKKTVDFERVKTILLFVSVIIMMVMLVMRVWDDLFNQGDKRGREDQEGESGRLKGFSFRFFTYIYIPRFVSIIPQFNF